MPPSRWLRDFGWGRKHSVEEPAAGPPPTLDDFNPPPTTEATRDATGLPRRPFIRPAEDPSVAMGLLPVPAPELENRTERLVRVLTENFGRGEPVDAAHVSTPGTRLVETLQRFRSRPQATVGPDTRTDLARAVDRQAAARQEELRQAWHDTPGVVRHAVAASEGIVSGVTAGHPQALLSDDKLERFSELPLSTSERAAQAVGFLTGATGAIATQNAAVAGAGRLLPVTSRAATAVRTTGRGASTAVGTLARDALEGVPYDLALPAEDAGDRMQNVGIGLAGATLANRLLRFGDRQSPVAPDDVLDAIDRTQDASSPSPSLEALRRALAPFQTQAGGVPRAAVGTAGGAAAGGTAGALLANDENKVGGAITGALIGARGGYLLGRTGMRPAGTRPQLADSDADVQAVLATSATPAQRQTMVGRLRALKSAAPVAVRKTYQSLLDDLYAARRFGREIGDTEEVSIEASRSRGWRGWADEMIGLRPRPAGSTSTNPTLREALDSARGIEDDVVALTRAERALELARSGMPDKGVELTAATATAQKLGSVPEVRQAADRLRGFYRHLLDLRYRNGLLDDDAYQRIVDSGEFYVPFVRDFGEEAGRAGSSGGKLFNRSSGVRRMGEGEASAPIVDPFEQAVLDAQATARDVSRQRVFNVVASIVERDPDAAADWLRPIAPKFLGKAEDGRPILTTPFGEDGRVIQAVVGGKRKYYEVVDEDLYDSLASIAPETNGVFQRIADVFSLPARTLRAGVTAMPAFGAANAMRDSFFTSLAYTLPVRQSVAGALTGGAIGAATDEESALRGMLRGVGFGLGTGAMMPHALRLSQGLRHIVRNDDVYQSFLREGGSGTGFFVGSRGDAGSYVDRLRKQGVSASDVFSPRSWWDALQALNRAVEEAPRVARFEDALGRGGSHGGAAVAAREVSLDFSRGGSGTQEIRKLKAFWNPTVQGLDKLRNVLNPAKNPQGYAVGLAAMTAPTVALWSLNKDNPDYWQQPLWIRNTSWLVPTGHHEDGATRFLYIPKPFEVGFVFASLPERALDYAWQRDPERLQAALTDMLGSTAGDLLPIPTAAEPILETRMGGSGGWDSFRQRPVVDYHLQPLPAREQFDGETSSLAVGLSRAAELGSFGLVQPSPEKVEHILEGYTGTAGRVLNRGVTSVARATGVDDRPEPPDLGRSQWARFVSRPNGFSTEDVATMFRRFEGADRHRVQYERLVEAGDVDAAARYFEDYREDIELVGALRGQVGAFRRLAAQRREIERDPNLSGEEKREIIAQLGQQAAQIATLAVGVPEGGPGGLPNRRQPALAVPRSGPEVPQSQEQDNQPNPPRPRRQDSRWSRDYGF